MGYVTDRLGHIAAAIVLIALVAGTSAAGAAPLQLAQATPAPAASQPTPAAPHARKPAVHSARTLSALADLRIADLHKRLQITAAQEPQFTAMADVMRANAQSMDALIHEQSQDTDRTAVSGLRWYERLTETHAAALHRFVPAFAALYAGLSDSQKKTADTTFQRVGQPPPRHSHRSK